MRVLHIITNLGQGGAEAVLHRLVAASSGEHTHIVVSLMGDAHYGPLLRDLGVEVHCLNKPRGRVTVSGLIRLRDIVRHVSPDVIQTWMYHADLVGGLVAYLAGYRTIVWGVRHSNLDERKSSRLTRLTVATCALLSGWVPREIVCCSVRAASIHQAMGYAKEKFTIIPNGFDLRKYAPDRTCRRRMRLEWGVSESDVLIGMVARWDPQKDHRSLIAACAQVKSRIPQIRCVLVGTGLDRSNDQVRQLLAELGLERHVILAGPRRDIPAVMNALDLHVLSSAYGEAFPNVVAEAMACGIPCVVTDVGDAAMIVGDTGLVVPPSNVLALAAAIEAALAKAHEVGRDQVGAASRRRVEEMFGLEKMVVDYHLTWERVARMGTCG